MQSNNEEKAVLAEMMEGWQERLKLILIFILVLACFGFALYPV